MYSAKCLFSYRDDLPEHLGKAFLKHILRKPSHFRASGWLASGLQNVCLKFSVGKRSFANQPYFFSHSFSKLDNLIEFPIFYNWYCGTDSYH